MENFTLYPLAFEPKPLLGSELYGKDRQEHQLYGKYHQGYSFQEGQLSYLLHYDVRMAFCVGNNHEVILLNGKHQVY
jgi:hypothetical protein